MIQFITKSKCYRNDSIYPIAIFLKSYAFHNEHTSTGVYKFD
jgi:hypothetical protein